MRTNRRGGRQGHRTTTYMHCTACGMGWAEGDSSDGWADQPQPGHKDPQGSEPPRFTRERCVPSGLSIQRHVEQLAAGSPVSFATMRNTHLYTHQSSYSQIAPQVADFLSSARPLGKKIIHACNIFISCTISTSITCEDRPGKYGAATFAKDINEIKTRLVVDWPEAGPVGGQEVD